ncbi:MAG: hypothetical protein ACK58L_21835 [Planctomycetota bacterium]
MDGTISHHDGRAAVVPWHTHRNVLLKRVFRDDPELKMSPPDFGMYRTDSEAEAAANARGHTDCPGRRVWSNADGAGWERQTDQHPNEFMMRLAVSVIEGGVTL